MYDFTAARMIAVECVKRAGELVLRELSNGSLTSESKPCTGDVVTPVDVASECYITSVLRRHFPCHTILGEEGCVIKQESQFTWVIDPVDGTGVMLRGLNYFGISIGLLEKGVPVVGAIYFPKLDVLIETQSGIGTWLNGKQVGFQSGTSLTAGALAFDFSCRKGNRDAEEERFLHRLPDPQSIPVYACTTYAALRLLQGKIDAFVHAGAQVFDIGAVLLAIKEAGGDYIFVEDPNESRINIQRQFVPFVMSRNPYLARHLVQMLMGQPSSLATP